MGKEVMLDNFKEAKLKEIDKDFIKLNINKIEFIPKAVSAREKIIAKNISEMSKGNMGNSLQKK